MNVSCFCIRWKSTALGVNALSSPVAPRASCHPTRPPRRRVSVSVLLVLLR